MNHQPFENWLLSEDPLPPENKRELDAHLQTCDQCRDLQEACFGVATLFQDVLELEPAPGFVERWSDRLAIEKRLDQSVRHRWQSIIMLILIVNVIGGLVFLLGSQFLTTFDTPMALLLSGIYRLTSMVTIVNTVQNIFITLFRTIISVVPAGLWAILGVGLIGSGAIWFISITSLYELPRRSKS